MEQAVCPAETGAQRADCFSPQADHFLCDSKPGHPIFFRGLHHYRRFHTLLLKLATNMVIAKDTACEVECISCTSTATIESCKALSTLWLSIYVAVLELIDNVLLLNAVPYIT